MPSAIRFKRLNHAYRADRLKLLVHMRQALTVNLYELHPEGTNSLTHRGKLVSLTMVRILDDKITVTSVEANATMSMLTSLPVVLIILGVLVLISGGF